MFNNQNNQNNQNQNNRHFNGNWNPDNNHSQPHSHGTNMASSLPTVIDSNLTVYVMGGLVAYSIYTKYFKKQDYDGDGSKEGCPVSTDALNFNR